MPHNERHITDYHAGDALEIVCTVQDDTGNVIDISGATDIEWYLKEDPSDEDTAALLTKTLGDGDVTISDGPGGEFVVKVATGDTADMSGQKHHRARLIDGDGDRSTVFHGMFTIQV